MHYNDADYCPNEPDDWTWQSDIYCPFCQGSGIVSDDESEGVCIYCDGTGYDSP